MFIFTHLRHVCDSQHKAYRIEDIRLSRTIEASYSIEGRVPAGDGSPDWVGFEAFEDELFDPHRGSSLTLSHRRDTHMTHNAAPKSVWYTTNAY